MKKRSKYKPKGVIMDTMAWLRAGMTRVEECSDGTTLKIRNHDAMNQLRLGTATYESINAIIHAMNVAEALAKRGIGDDWTKEIISAQDHLFTLAERGVNNGYKFIVRGEELKALNLAMEIHDAQLNAVTVRELEKAMDDVLEIKRQRKMRSVKTKPNELVQNQSQ